VEEYFNFGILQNNCSYGLLVGQWLYESGFINRSLCNWPSHKSEEVAIISS